MAELSQEQVDALQALIEQNKPQVVTPPAVAQPTGFSLKIGGNDYSVRDGDEAQRLLDQYEAQRGQEIEAERVKSVAAQQRLEQVQNQYAPRSNGQDTFSKEEYARLFLEDPRKARRYELAHDPEQMAFYSGLTAQISQLKLEQAGTQFLMQHRDDYVATPENYKAIESIISQYNLPWDLNGMNLAFSVAKQMGQIDGQQSQQAQQQQEDEPIQAAPRVARRRSSQNQAAAESAEMLTQFENLTPEKQKAYLESLATQQ